MYLSEKPRGNSRGFKKERTERTQMRLLTSSLRNGSERKCRNWRLHLVPHSHGNGDDVRAAKDVIKYFILIRPGWFRSAPRVDNVLPHVKRADEVGVEREWNGTGGDSSGGVGKRRDAVRVVQWFSIFVRALI